MLATDWLAGHSGLERARLVSDASLGYWYSLIVRWVDWQHFKSLILPGPHRKRHCPNVLSRSADRTRCNNPIMATVNAGQVLVPSCIHRHVCLRVSIPVTPKRVLNLQVSRDGTLYVDANHREAACVIRILCTKAPLAYKCLQRWEQTPGRL